MTFDKESDALLMESVIGPNGATWRLKEPVKYKVSQGTIYVPYGFRFDLASIPSWARWYVSNDDYRIRRPAAVHDWLYVNKGQVGLDNGNNVLLDWTYTRKQADDIFYQALRKEGVGKIKAYIMWIAVRLGGGEFV